MISVEMSFNALKVRFGRITHLRIDANIAPRLLRRYHTMSQPVLEEIISAILLGENFGRKLTFREHQAVDIFKNLMGEYMAKRMIELTELSFDAIEKRKKIDETMMNNFSASWQDAVSEFDETLPRT